MTVQANEAARTMLAGHEPLIVAQAKIGELTMAAEGAPPAGTVMNVVGGVQVCVHLAGAIDKAAEEQRIDKEKKKLEKERAGVVGRLADPSFKDRAPADVVEKTQRDLAGLDERLAKLAGSLERLKTL